MKIKISRDELVETLHVLEGAEAQARRPWGAEPDMQLSGLRNRIAYIRGVLWAHTVFDVEHFEDQFATEDPTDDRGAEYQAVAALAKVTKPGPVGGTRVPLHG